MTGPYNHYAFQPFTTGLVAWIGDLDSDGAFFVEPRRCVGYVTTGSKYAVGGGRTEQQYQTSLAVLSREFEYVVEPLDELSANAPSAVIVAILPVGEQPDPDTLADRERFSRECLAMYERGVERRRARTHRTSERNAA